MTNARLMEDNESFQVLLSEKTLNGDFSRGDFMRGTSVLDDRPATSNGPSTSLADELESAEDVGDAEHTRRLEGEVNKLKEQNKALTLYINKIIERVLQHQGFESILDKNDLEETMTGSPPLKPNTDKDLPPPPPPKENAGATFLQRAKSIANRATSSATTNTAATNENRKPRPMSYVPPSNPNSVNEDPNTAPSVPLQQNLQRSNTNRHSGQYHRRSNSEWPSASIVSNMYRGPPPASSASTSGQVSPGIASPRNSFFGALPGGPVPSSRAPSGTTSAPSTNGDETRPGTTTPNEGSIDTQSVSLDTPSPPRSVASSFDRPSGAVISGRGPRPLRLVQEAREQDEADAQARKAANRGSWIAGGIAGWFNANKNSGEPGGAQAPQ